MLTYDSVVNEKHFVGQYVSSKFASKSHITRSPNCLPSILSLVFIGSSILCVKMYFANNFWFSKKQNENFEGFLKNWRQFQKWWEFQFKCFHKKKLKLIIDFVVTHYCISISMSYVDKCHPGIYKWSLFDGLHVCIEGLAFFNPRWKMLSKYLILSPKLLTTIWWALNSTKKYSRLSSRLPNMWSEIREIDFFIEFYSQRIFFFENLKIYQKFISKLPINYL